ncbi:MAG: pilus assembly protein PilY [Gammaproteobacteria bacterium]|nr:MAG: pilus assembly protein PilY [Gammaproteobacteria bacterium]
MKISSRSYKSSVLSFALTAGVLCSPNAVADLNIADEPLYMGIQADPNIMFILDDSGSMHWEYMPGEAKGGAHSFSYLFPQPIQVYGTGSYAWDDGGNCTPFYLVPDFDDDNAYNLVMRSPQFNKIFYNPDTEYKPWSNSDGTLMNNADPANALYNPGDPSVGGMDLTAQQALRAHWFEHTNSAAWPVWPVLDCDNGALHTFWPITYYLYNGGDKNSISSYTKVQITSSTPASQTFTSPSGIVRTRDEEIANFANWFSYYRSRILTARAGIGAAFATQGEDLRVGFATLNQGTHSVDGRSTRTIIDGVRSFRGADRGNFYEILYKRPVLRRGTPLRRALDAVGQYYTRTDNQGPWGQSPGINNTTDHIECRKSYSILMTDGYWLEGDSMDADTADAKENNDGIAGPDHSNPDPENYVQRPDGTDYKGYIASSAFSGAFSDAVADTLADVAMYYWKNDLRSDLENKVRVRKQGDAVQEISDPAYWQHMVTFGVGLGVSGQQDVDDAFTAVKNNTPITWPNPFDADRAKIDDLLHASINSRGGFFSASNPDQFAAELKAVLDTISSDKSSSSSAVANTTRLDTNTYIYQAKFAPDNWSGQFLAFEFDANTGIDTDHPAWDADDKLPAHSDRDIFTYKPGDGGVEFLWNNLSSAQQGYLNRDIYSVVDGLGEDRLAFLRGDSSVIGPATAPFRDRTSEDTHDKDGVDLLGDIINSDPVFVGLSDYGYGYSNAALSATEKTKYIAFRSSGSYLGRDPMVYVGANDGMLHGFDAETGKETFAFIPNAVYPRLSALTSSSYTHQYYVDASPHVADAYINNNWATVLVSSLGAGGRALFAIDVTDPGSVGAGDILWEIQADSGYADLKHMGYMLGSPQIARTKNGEWVALVGNGYNSTEHKAALLVVKLSDGNIIKVINTGVGDPSNPNGLATPLAVDLDTDRVLDVAYAGDLHGNLWKFDFSSANPNDWDVAIKSSGSPAPLFQACDGDSCNSNTRQPITTKPTIAVHDKGVMVIFGTGKYFEDQDAIVNNSPRTEALYGIFDCGKNAVTGLCGDTVKRDELVEQEIIFEDDRGTTARLDDDIRVISDNSVDISSSTQGWYIELKSPGASHGAGERVISKPVIVNDAVLFVTFTPDINPCNFGGSSWVLEVQPESGSRFVNAPKLDVNNDGVIDAEDYVEVNGENVYISGDRFGQKLSTPALVHYQADNGDFLVKKVSTGSGGNTPELDNLSYSKQGRQSWRQLK